MVVEYFEALVRDSFESARRDVEVFVELNVWQLLAFAALAGFSLGLR